MKPIEREKRDDWGRKKEKDWKKGVKEKHKAGGMGKCVL